MIRSYIAQNLRFVSLILVVSAPLVACGGESGDGEIDDSTPSCEEDTRDDTFVAGITKTGAAGFKLALVDSLPAPPTRGDNQWSLELRDASDALMPGYSIEAEPFMPDHGHGTAVQVLFTDDGDGTYTLNPVNFFMPGYWETTVTIVDTGATDSEDDDTDIDTMVFKFCIDG